MLMRFAYAIVTYLMSPLYALYWLLRGLGDNAYWDRFGQRFGFGYPELPEGCIWIHAVSVGEVQAAVPLVRALAERFPDRSLLITTVTPTGAARARDVFGDQVHHCFLPFETPHAVYNFFNATRPHVALIMETEIWPNLYYVCGRRKIPLILVSARISPKSVGKYRPWLPLFSETLSYGIVIAAQSEADAERFKSLGASPERTRVTGNIKFDIKLDERLIERGAGFRRRHMGERPVWIAASTHDKEEGQVLRAHRKLIETLADAVLILVPRHPERFAGVKTALQRKGFRFVSRTDGVPCQPDMQVFLGDTMGEVPLFYAASDIAFVGGTLVPVGGHNLLEPAALGRPIITGPHLFNTQDIADKFADLGASIMVHDADELAAALERLFADRDTAAAIGNKGLQVLERNRGALQRLFRILEPLIDDVDNGLRRAER